MGIDRGVAVSAALSTGELLHAPGLTARERIRLRRMQRMLAREVDRHAVTARGGDGATRPVNREPHLLLPSA